MQSNYTPKDIENFLNKVDKSNGIDSCWIWTGCLTHNGYGNTRIQGKAYRTHRLSWIINYGEIPDGYLVCHHCDNRKCCNPKHLFLGTAQDNADDMRKKGRMCINEKRWNCKLSLLQVEEIRNRYLSGESSQLKLAKEFGVGRDQISRIVNYKRRKS